MAYESVNTFNTLEQKQAEQRRMAEQILKERMNSLGVTQTPLSVQTGNAMAGLADQGRIARQNEAFNQQQEYLKNQYALQDSAQQAGILAKQQMYRGAVDLEDENNKFATYYKLYTARKLTPSQFKKLTGIDVRSLGGAKRTSKPERIEDFFNNPDYKDAPMLENFAPSGGIKQNISQFLKG